MHVDRRSEGNPDWEDEQVPEDIRNLTPAVTVREATRADLAQILDIQRRAERAISDAFVASMSGAIDDPDRTVVLAEQNGLPLGWAATKYFPEVDAAAPAGHYLMGMTVVPARRREGIGAFLVSARMEWIANHSHSAFYFASMTNEASIRSHRAWPFVETARAARFRGVAFSSGTGILFSAGLR